MESTFELNGTTFQLSKLDAIKQFHIVRRVGPALAGVFSALTKSGIPIDKKKEPKLTSGQELELTAKIAAPLMDQLAKMSDEDAEYVLHNLLSAVELQQKPVGNWVKIYSNGNMMVQTLELPVLMQLAGRAFLHNLSGFFSALPQ